MAGRFSPEFRRRAVELARERIKPMPEIAEGVASTFVVYEGGNARE